MSSIYRQSQKVDNHVHRTWFSVKNKKYSGILFEIDTYKNLIIYLCAGAGGSIIAAHADKFTTDKQSDISNESELEVNNRHKELNNKIYALQKTQQIQNLYLKIIGLLIIFLLISSIYIIYKIT